MEKEGRIIDLTKYPDIYDKNSDFSSSSPGSWNILEGKSEEKNEKKQTRMICFLLLCTWRHMICVYVHVNSSVHQWEREI